jgi:hypothetical protein
MLLWQQQLSEHLQPMAPWKQLFSIFRIQNYKRGITINLQVILVKIILDDKLITYSGFQLWQKKKRKRKRNTKTVFPLLAKRKNDSSMPTLPYLTFL